MTAPITISAPHARCLFIYSGSGHVGVLCLPMSLDESIRICFQNRTVEQPQSQVQEAYAGTTADEIFECGKQLVLHPAVTAAACTLSACTHNNVHLTCMHRM